MQQAQRPASLAREAAAWYLAECQRGQGLLDSGRTEQATDVFVAVLERLGVEARFERAVVLGRLGRCLLGSDRAEPAATRLREALAIASALDASDGVKRLRGALHSQLGDALLAAGDHRAARIEFAAALGISEQLGNARAQAVDLARLGALAAAEGNLHEAEQRHSAALSLLRRGAEPSALAAALEQLAKVLERQGRSAEARRALVEALAIARDRCPTAPEVWSMFALLGKVLAQEAASVADPSGRALLEAKAQDFQELGLRAPKIAATLDALAGVAGYGSVVMRARMGRCFQLAGWSELAIASMGSALEMAADLPPGDHGLGLQGSLRADLGQVLAECGRLDEAEQAITAALQIAQTLNDLRGQALHSEQLAALAHSRGKLVRAEPVAACAAASPGVEDTSQFIVTIDEDVAVDYVFDTDLLVDGRRERRSTVWSDAQQAIADDVCPVLMPCTRSWSDDDGAVRFAVSLQEPAVERHPGCVVMRRVEREVAVGGAASLLSRLVWRLDGRCTVGQIVLGVDANERAMAARLLAALAATGVLDVSGRPIGRWLHATTKKGVVPGGGLEGDDILRYAMNGQHRRYPQARQIQLGEATPDRLRDFHALTRKRRSRRDYQGPALSRAEFDALLHTACGVTGSMAWQGRESQLRAYPASGGLYAVEIYPVVLDVDGIEPGVYHHCPEEKLLELVKPLDRDRFLCAMLPVERQMVAGAGTMICLTGFFPRHEHKYGQGGYRMLVAEAGHLSQNLVLTATALGLAARPFGGVFDELVNEDLGLDTAQEQFLLSVLVGRAASQT
ncbi:MAG TPA: SagB family peptide dehydrogenase [Burkholderiaceae bacterium]|nr:SagB family peptide dehydrogenase [Burkholderiaceae bacterium]